MDNNGIINKLDEVDDLIADVYYDIDEPGDV